MKISYKEASHVVNTIVAELEKKNQQAVIAVVDSHGELTAFLRMENTKIHCINLAINKAYTAARAQRPTSEIGKLSNDPVSGFDIASYGDPKYTGFGGGVPMKQNGLVIGGLGVSGLSSEEDEELALLGIKSINK